MLIKKDKKEDMTKKYLIRTKKLDKMDLEYESRYKKYNMANKVYEITKSDHRGLKDEGLGQVFIKEGRQEFLLYKWEFSLIEEDLLFSRKEYI